MTRILPANPNLYYLKSQAKDLLKAQKQGDPSVCETLRLLHQFTKLSDAEILAAPLALNEIQFALAMDYGFSSWNALKHYVERLSSSGPIQVIREGDEVRIDGVRKLEWGKGQECTFIGALTAALNRIGNPVSYDDLMGLSGAAFRFCFAHPRWDYSSVDGMLGYNHGEAAMVALGYRSHYVSAETQDQGRREICESIDGGIPALGIDFAGAPEWGVITGYTDGGRVLLCRTYFDDPQIDEYNRSERYPWLNLIIGDKGTAPSPRESLLSSLRIARRIAQEDDRWFLSMGGTQYARGLTGLETWANDLMDESRFAEIESLKHHGAVQRFVYDSLIDARQAGVRYLREYAELLEADMHHHLSRAADIYEQEVTLLRDRIALFPHYNDLDFEHLSPVIRKAASELILRLRNLEQQAIHEFESVLVSE